MIRKHLTSATLLLLAMTALVSAETVVIATRENTLREDCRFLAPAKAKLQVGDQLDVVAREGDWLRVTFRNTAGCIHKNAIRDKSAALTDASGTGYRATGDEVALAGKGFNPEVERSYRGKHPELDYNAVENIEAYRISDERLREFITTGGLKQP